MRDKAKIILAFLLFCVGIISVSAGEYTNAEKARLKKEAAKVDLTYEEVIDVLTRTEIPERGDGLYDVEYSYFMLTLNNMTKELNVIISNDNNDDVIAVGYNSLKNGVFTFQWINIDEVVTFSYDVYGSNNTDCFGEKLATGHLVTPKYNLLHETVLCRGLDDLPECKKYIKENVDQDVLEKRIREYKEQKAEEEEKIKNMTKFEKMLAYIKQHKIAAIGVTVIIAGAGVALVINKRKRRAI